MTYTVSATQAHAHLGVLIRRVVERHEPVIVEHSGSPYIVLIPFDEYERLYTVRGQVPWREALKRLLEVGTKIKAFRAGKPLPPPEEVIREAREERDVQLTGLR